MSSTNYVLGAQPRPGPPDAARQQTKAKGANRAAASPSGALSEGLSGASQDGRKNGAEFAETIAR
jgi:hypothetical protein